MPRHRPSATREAHPAKAQQILGYHFHTPSTLCQALSADKALALHGDALIQQILVKEGLHRHASTRRINQVLKTASNAHLSRRGYSTGLAACIRVTPGQNGCPQPGPVADAMEAVLAAINEDSAENMGAVESVMKRLGIWWP
ncbi:Uncharacterized protein PECH_002514 [Penicillium ucsense]|uniref:RNase III domain-containing protein n=1 Tax=Penicillium ucsense TaxID=2839758 RepID=A0A8J8VWP9_9EURO|nr:Uncharacterized protein PECM_001948 [Penicillium ucsense]KAF7730889.1 Uncharacterized protein PECH_002514 [Penicillium ucsense]